jgi:hypothetical protein
MIDVIKHAMLHTYKHTYPLFVIHANGDVVGYKVLVMRALGIAQEHGHSRKLINKHVEGRGILQEPLFGFSIVVIVFIMDNYNRE